MLRTHINTALPRVTRREAGGKLPFDLLPDAIRRLLQDAGELAERLDLSVYVVGGFVRDLLLDIPNIDLDIVVEGDGIAFARALAEARKARLKTHARFGTATLIFADGFKMDVATARTERYEHSAALPSVEPSSIKKDLYRRDFTINTLAMHLNTSSFAVLVDFYGGQRDLADRTIRVLHSLSFVDDPTRIFRAIRFEQRLALHMSKETLALIKGAVKMDLLSKLSAHRVLQELILLFSEDQPSKVMARMAELNMLRVIHPSLAWSVKLQSLVKGVEDALDWYRALGLDRKLNSWVVYFLALMDALPAKAVSETLVRLKIPERCAEEIRIGRSRVSRLLEQGDRRPADRPSEIYHRLSGLSDESLLLLVAKTKSEPVRCQIAAYLTTYQYLKPFLNGQGLKAMGLTPGPNYKKVLANLLDARLNGEVKNVNDERNLVKQMARLSIGGV